jgi:AraC-like DNA-binding protein
MKERAHLGTNDSAMCSVRLFAPFRAALQEGTARVCYLSEIHPDQRVPHRVVTGCLRHAVLQNRARALGLEAALATTSDTFDLIEYIIRSAPTLLAGVEAASGHLVLLHDGAAMQVQTRRDGVSLSFSLRAGLTDSRELAQFAIASALLSLRRVTERPIAPVRVHFRHKALPGTDAYSELFRCPLLFTAEHDALVISADDMRRPLPGADPGLHAYLLRSASDRIEALSRRSAFSLRVREHVAAELRQGNPSVANICKLLGMSERSLNRRLGQEQTTYRALVDDLRRQLALQHLEETDRTLEEIAFLVGFSHSAAFHRAFRRWMHGETPSTYRRRMARTPRT